MLPSGWLGLRLVKFLTKLYLLASSLLRQTLDYGGFGFFFEASVKMKTVTDSAYRLAVVYGINY